MSIFTRVLRNLYIVLFLSIMLIPLFKMNIKKNVVSEIDNRKLVEFPSIEADGFAEGVESFIQDRIGYRDRLVTGYQKLNYNLTGEHPGYTCGKEGYMFFKIHNNFVYNDYHKAFAAAVVKMDEYCKSRGIPFYFMFDPEKTSVYTRYLPDGINYNDNWVDEMLSYIEDKGVSVIYNKDILIDKSREEQVFNRRFDVGHWNDLGMFYGTNNLWNAVHNEFPAVKEYSKDEFEISSKIEEYLVASRFRVDEEVPVFTIKTDCSDIKSKYQGLHVDKQWGTFLYYKNNSEFAEMYPKALIFHGSYYNRNPKFFVGRTRDYIGIHNYQNVLNLDYYFNYFQPEVVVFEVAEYTFSDEYFNYGKMVNLDFNPGLNDGTVSNEDVIKEIKNKAEHFNLLSEKNVYVVDDGVTEKAYFFGELDDLHYAYLLSNEGIYDFKSDEYGNISVEFPVTKVTNPHIYFIDNQGIGHYTEVEPKKAKTYMKNDSNVTKTAGVTSNDGSRTYALETNMEGNHFNSVVMTLSDMFSGDYINQPVSLDYVSEYTDSFLFEGKSGEYELRLRANSNLQDESISTTVHLTNGERYYYHFSIDEISGEKVVISDIDFLGLN